jgi:hypothetical protein
MNIPDNRNTGYKKFKQPFSWIFILVLLMSLTFPFQAWTQEKEKSQVRISWQQFRELLKLDTDDITLTWDEFKQLVSQTGEDIPVSYTVKNGKIVLPRQQFAELLKKMKPPHTTVSGAPAEYVISKASYSGTLDKKSATIDATFSLEIFESRQKKYFRIPIVPQINGLAEVFLDGKPALVLAQNGWYNVTTTETGHHEIKVKYYTAANLEKGPQILNLGVVQTAITLLDLRVPLENVDIAVPGAKELTLSPQNGFTRVRAVIPATGAISVNAHRKYTQESPDKKDIPAKVYAESMNLISIEEDALRVTSRIKLNILQNAVTHIRAIAPEGYNILYINKSSGERLRDWQIKKEDNGQVLEIPLDSPIEGSFSLDILSERLFEDKQTAVHFSGFRILDAVRETGYVGAEKKSTAEAAPTNADKLDRVDIKDLPFELVQMSKRPLLFGYRYLRHPWDLAMSITRHEELPTMSTVIDMASVITVVLEDGKTLTRVNYTIRNTWKQFLKLNLPKDSEVWTVYVDNKRENASRNGEGMIMIPLARSRSKGVSLESFTVDITYFSKGEPLGSWGSSRVWFPTADIMVGKMLWSVYLPQDFAYLHFDGNVEKEEIASTWNLLLGNKRNFSIDQVHFYNEVASNLEKAPHSQSKMDGYQMSVQSKFDNSYIVQQDMANQLRQEANLNMDFKQELGKRLGQPGSGGNIFKIELPTSGQIYRFNKTIIEGEPIQLTFYYTSDTLHFLAMVLLLLIVLFILFLLRKKLAALVKAVFKRLSVAKKALNYMNTTTGLRITLFISALIFLFISHVLFVVLALLFLIAVFRPEWLIRGLKKKKNLATDEHGQTRTKDGKKDEDIKESEDGESEKAMKGGDDEK